MRYTAVLVKVSIERVMRYTYAIVKFCKDGVMRYILVAIIEKFF